MSAHLVLVFGMALSCIDIPPNSSKINNLDGHIAVSSKISTRKFNFPKLVCRIFRIITVLHYSLLKTTVRSPAISLRWLTRSCRMVINWRSRYILVTVLWIWHRSRCYISIWCTIPSVQHGSISSGIGISLGKECVTTGVDSLWQGS